jgi:hypothetical protein
MAPPAAAATLLKAGPVQAPGATVAAARRGRPRATNPPGAPGPGSESSDTVTGTAAGLRIIIRVVGQAHVDRPRAIITRRDSPQCLALAGVY